MDSFPAMLVPMPANSRFRWSQVFRRPGFTTVIRGALRYLFGKRGQRRVKGLRLFYRTRLLVMTLPGLSQTKLRGTTGVRIWVDGDEAFPRLERLIRHARHTIVIQMFIWKDDETGRRIAKRLLEAAERGVHVDITKEAAGDVFEFWNDFLGTQRSPSDLWKQFWSHPRIRIHYGNNRDHAKVYVIDDDILLLTGMNIADEYRYDWHDYMVELRGREFVEQYLARRAPSSPNARVHIVMNTEEGAAIRPMLIKLLREAKESIIIEHCYLSDPEVLGHIIDLSKRGIEVTMILPARTDFHHHANMASVGQLITQGDPSLLRVLIYPGMFHSKILLVDHNRAFLGSANLMRSSLDDMGEVNVLIQGGWRALWKLRESLGIDTLKSRPLSGPPRFVWLSRWLAWLGL
jgi:cardiolipin synthase A/B